MTAREGTQQTDVVVIGGGISGMSLAYYCARAGRKVTVIERDSEPGGCVHTQRIDGRFWFELGAHTCYNSYGSLLEIIQQSCGLGVLLPRQKVPFRLLVNGEIRPIARHLHVLELLRHAPNLFFVKKQGRSVHDYYSRIVGTRNYDEIFGPLFAAVPSQRADEFPAEMLFKRRERRKDVLRSWSVQRGLQSIVETISRVSGVTLITRTTALALRREDEGFAVETSAGVTYRARWACLAVPPPFGATLAASSFPNLSYALSRVGVSKVKSFGVAVPRNATRAERFAGVIPLDGSFFSAVSRDTVPDDHLRGFTFHFGPEVGREQALRLICRVLRIEMSQIEDVAEREVLLPSPKRGHAEIASQIDAAIAGQPLLVTGNFFAGLSIEDCVQRSKSEAERMMASGNTFG